MKAVSALGEMLRATNAMNEMAWRGLHVQPQGPQPLTTNGLSHDKEVCCPAVHVSAGWRGPRSAVYYQSVPSPQTLMHSSGHPSSHPFRKAVLSLSLSCCLSSGSWRRQQREPVTGTRAGCPGRS